MSTRFPEEIPWFNASQRAAVAAMVGSCLKECISEKAAVVWLGADDMQIFGAGTALSGIQADT